METELHERLTSWRRHLHRNPELSLQERQTAEFVCARMTSPSTKARDELGHRVRPLRELVEESYRWLEAQGLLTAP